VKINKLIFLGLFFLLAAAMVGWPASPAHALAPIDQDCQYAIAPNSPYTFLSHEPAQVLMPTRSTLDAIAVYIKTDIGGTSQVKADFLSTTDTSAQTIASKTQTIDSTAQWVTFDFPDVAMPHPYGIIRLTQADSNHAVWYQCPQASYTAGFGVTDGVNSGYNYRFAVYTYDAADPGASSTSADTDSSTDTGVASDAATSSGATGDQPPGSNKKSTGSTGKTQTTTPTTKPDTDALLKSLKAEQQSSGQSGVLPMIFFFLVRAAIPLFLLFLFFVACLVGLILFLRSRQKKTAPAPAPATPTKKSPQPESGKP
jgi:hypothetical protein